jgi:hypothetical protein
MSRETKYQRVERILFGAATEARAKGLRIVFGIFEEHDAFDNVTGCCALGAIEHAPAPRFTHTDRAYEAIELGFDAEGLRYARKQHADSEDFEVTFGGQRAPRPFPLRWYQIGAQLRRRLRPVEARDGHAPSRSKMKINFTPVKAVP